MAALAKCISSRESSHGSSACYPRGAEVSSEGLSGTGLNARGRSVLNRHNGSCAPSGERIRTAADLVVSASSAQPPEIMSVVGW